MPVRPLNDVQSGLLQRLRDRRSQRVVFLSHCILNENTRYLGGACRGGCIQEIIEQCVRNELGIVQMPCPEQHAWGGVLKRYLLLAYGLSERHPLAYRLRRLLLVFGLFYTRRLYRRMAKGVAEQIEDYIASGFSVVGVVGIDGSPTCAVNTTLDLTILDRILAISIQSITVEKQSTLLRQCAKAGRGIFIEELQTELKRRRVSTPFLAHDLLAELNGQPSNVVLASDRLADLSGHSP